MQRIAIVALSLLVSSCVPMAQVGGGIPAACLHMPLPSSLKRVDYEKHLGAFLEAECHKRLTGWVHDVEVRDSGPALIHLPAAARAWERKNVSVHRTVLVWYSPDVLRWMKDREKQKKKRKPEPVKPIADGEMIIKLMWPGVTAAEMNRDLAAQGLGPRDLPPADTAHMIKDSGGSRDGWFWGNWTPHLPMEAQLDWPPPKNYGYPWNSFGAYCLNCHASAEEDFTFSHLPFVEGDPEHFPTFLQQDLPLGPHPPEIEADGDEGDASEHADKPVDPITRVSQPRHDFLPDFLAAFAAGALSENEVDGASVSRLPPEPYDHVWPGPEGATGFLTSDQCVGCHAAGATGMHFDMTARPDPDRPLVNLSPYGEWRSSPMGLAGRDPIFFAQLESERSLHEELDASIQDLCLHCHGVMGQRQFCMDQPGRGGDPLARCSSSGLMDLKLPGEGEAERELFTRAALDADPLGDPEGQHGAARYGALARDGISCAVCHRLQVEDYRAIGMTFTGDFLLGPADRVTGPFEKPQVGHMERSLGVTPVHDPRIRDSEVCASCHSVVLPVLGKGGQLERFEDGSPRFVLEQGTYLEWFFSGYRDGRGGAEKRSCQDCHMPKRYSGQDLSFKIATIQEASNFPETENRLSRAELDLEPRAPYARHTLVGLNVFLNLMAQQFPDVLGLRIMDPMLVGLGRPGLETSYEAMVEQGQQRTVELEIEALAVSGGELAVDLAVRSLVGHRFPSGVGFRRAFVELSVLNARGDLLWRSGATDSAGLLIDSEGRPVDGERMWRPGCEPLQAGDPGAGFQPHHEVIRNSDQVQVYQELTVSPEGQPTTSFLSIASRAKDNRLLPLGFAPSKAVMGAKELGSPRLPLDELLLELEPVLSGEGSTWTETKVIEDADFGAGGDTVRYRIPLAELSGKPASVRATVYYQATPPFYLQDRFCLTPEGEDTKRLFYMAGRLDLEGTEAEAWKLRLSWVEGTL